MLYLISDLHWGEVRTEELFYAKDFFNSVDAYEIYTKERWIQKINKDDTVLIVGDAGNPIQYRELPGEKILIRGNHDNYLKEDYLGFYSVTDELLFDVNGVRLGIWHIPRHDEENIDVEICGHVHCVPNYLYMYQNKTQIFLLPNLLGYEPRSISELLSGNYKNWQFDFFKTKMNL